jgi:hypothetical protein
LKVISIWILDKFFYPLLSAIIPNIADRLMGKWFANYFYIDDIISTIEAKKVTFDIRVSNSIEQPISLTHLQCRLFNPPQKNLVYRSAIQDISATYEVFDKDGKLITTVGNEEFSDFSSMESKGNFIFQSKLLQKINAKDTDRFKFVIHLSALSVNPDLRHIEAIISYAYKGKSKTTKLVKGI